MEEYNEIVTKSLIDFEEIKLILANNNIDLVKSYHIAEEYYLNSEVSLKSATFQRILDNSYIIISDGNKQYLSYKSKQGLNVRISKMVISDIKDCTNLLLHKGYIESFNIEKNVYEYSNGNDTIYVIDILNLATFFCIKKKDASLLELKEILSSFNMPFNEDKCNEEIEKVVIAKLRRYI